MSRVKKTIDQAKKYIRDFVNDDKSFAAARKMVLEILHIMLPTGGDRKHERDLGHVKNKSVLIEKLTEAETAYVAHGDDDVVFREMNRKFGIWLSGPGDLTSYIRDIVVSEEAEDDRKAAEVKKIKKEEDDIIMAEEEEKKNIFRKKKEFKEDVGTVKEDMKIPKLPTEHAKFGKRPFVTNIMRVPQRKKTIKVKLESMAFKLKNMKGIESDSD